MPSAGFLRRVREPGQAAVMVQAAAEFLAEERVDVEAADRADARIASGRARLLPWSEVRRRLC